MPGGGGCSGQGRRCWPPRRLSALSSAGLLFLLSPHSRSLPPPVQSRRNLNPREGALPWVHLQRRKEGSAVTFKFLFQHKGSLSVRSCSWDHHEVSPWSSSCELPTFSLLKFAYLIRFKFTSYYLSQLSYFYSGHHLSLPNSKRETQNPNSSFLLLSSVACWSSAKDVSTSNPRAL